MMRRLFQPMMKHRSQAIKTPGGFIAGGFHPAVPLSMPGANYNFVTPVSPSDPLPGQLMIADGNTGVIRLNYVDADAIDREAGIRSMHRFDLLSFGGATWQVSGNVSYYATYALISVIQTAGPTPADALYFVTVVRP
jgi:hypothetical protein